MHLHDVCPVSSMEVRTDGVIVFAFECQFGDYIMQWNQNASGFQLGIVCIYDVNIDIILLVHSARLLMTT